jgi:hypothetical protein
MWNAAGRREASMTEQEMIEEWAIEVARGLAPITCPHCYARQMAAEAVAMTLNLIETYERFGYGRKKAMTCAARTAAKIIQRAEEQLATKKPAEGCSIH